MPVKKRIFGLDLAKSTAIFLVIVLHAMGPVFIQETNFNVKGTFLVRLIYYLATPAVPLFFMVNGFLILKKKQLTYRYILKKSLTLLIPVFSWNLLFFIAKFNFHRNYVIVVLESLMQKGFFFQFWFLGSLVLMLLIAPILQYFLVKKTNFFIIFLLCLATMCFFFDIFSHLNEFSLQSNITQTFRIWTWLLYYSLGGLFAYHPINFFKRHMAISGLFTMMFALLCGVWWIFNARFINNLYAEYNYDSIICVVLVTCIFHLFLGVNEAYISPWVEKTVSSVSSLSMGIFIVHVFFIRITSIWHFSIIGNMLTCLFVFLTSWMFTWLLNQSKILKKLFL